MKDKEKVTNKTSRALRATTVAQRRATTEGRQVTFSTAEIRPTSTNPREITGTSVRTVALRTNADARVETSRSLENLNIHSVGHEIQSVQINNTEPVAEIIISSDSNSSSVTFVTNSQENQIVNENSAQNSQSISRRNSEQNSQSNYRENSQHTDELNASENLQRISQQNSRENSQQNSTTSNQSENQANFEAPQINAQSTPFESPNQTLINVSNLQQQFPSLQQIASVVQNLVPTQNSLQQPSTSGNQSPQQQQQSENRSPIQPTSATSPHATIQQPQSTLQQNLNSSRNSILIPNFNRSQNLIQPANQFSTQNQSQNSHRSQNSTSRRALSLQRDASALDFLEPHVRNLLSQSIITGISINNSFLRRNSSPNENNTSTHSNSGRNTSTHFTRSTPNLFIDTPAAPPNFITNRLPPIRRGSPRAVSANPFIQRLLNRPRVNDSPATFSTPTANEFSPTARPIFTKTPQNAQKSKATRKMSTNANDNANDHQNSQNGQNNGNFVSQREFSAFAERMFERLDYMSQAIRNQGSSTSGTIPKNHPFKEKAKSSSRGRHTETSERNDSDEEREHRKNKNRKDSISNRDNGKSNNNRKSRSTQRTNRTGNRGAARYPDDSEPDSSPSSSDRDNRRRNMNNFNNLPYNDDNNYSEDDLDVMNRIPYERRRILDRRLKAIQPITSGTADHIKTFIRTVNIFMNGIENQDEEIYATQELKFKTTAVEYIPVDQIARTVLWSQLRRLLEREYKQTNTENALEAKLKTFQQNHTETIAEYGERARKLMYEYEAHFGTLMNEPLRKRLNREVTEQFVKKVKNAKVREALKFRGTAQLNEMISYAIEQEIIHQDEDADPEAVCNYCGKKGHREVNCHQKERAIRNSNVAAGYQNDRTCVNCGYKGHTKVHCFVRTNHSNNNSRTNNNIRDNRRSNDRRGYGSGQYNRSNNNNNNGYNNNSRNGNGYRNNNSNRNGNYQRNNGNNGGNNNQRNNNGVRNNYYQRNNGNSNGNGNYQRNNNYRNNNNSQTNNQAPSTQHQIANVAPATPSNASQTENN